MSSTNSILTSTFVFFVVSVGVPSLSLAVGHAILRQTHHSGYASPVSPFSFQIGAVGGAVFALPIFLLRQMFTGDDRDHVSSNIRVVTVMILTIIFHLWNEVACIIGVAIMHH